MSEDDRKKSTNYTKPLILFVFLLIVIASGYFGLNVRFSWKDGFSIGQSIDDPKIIIKDISSNPPDFVVLKNTSTETINIKGYKVKEGDKVYILPENDLRTTLDPEENLTIYFVKNNSSILDDSSKLASTAFRIKPGETIELIDSLGNSVGLKKAL